MGILRYAINVTLDGCASHEVGLAPDDESMAFWTAEIARAGALLYGRVTYEMMQAAWRRPAGGHWPAWMKQRDQAFAEAIDSAQKYVVSSTLPTVDWNAQLISSDLRASVVELKRRSDEPLLVGGVSLPRALASWGLIDEYLFLVHPIIAGRGPTLIAGLPEPIQVELVERQEFRSGAQALRYRPSEGLRDAPVR